MRIAALVTAIAFAGSALAADYEATWESLDNRPTPQWFKDAKFGIFIHWGLYSVPAWAPKGKYAEWYWMWMQDKDGETWKFHQDTYGEDFSYTDFAPEFNAELFDPNQWADIFKRSGAKYVVLTSKHHDGFALWPSEHSWNWNAVDAGPHRDLCGDLITAVQDAGLRMGYYYSIYEWFNPLYKDDPARYAETHAIPQLKDLVTRYEPDIVWADGEWDHPSDTWGSKEFLAWLYNESPVKDRVVVNDRWGKECRGVHGGFYTTEYGHAGVGGQPKGDHPWEECRGIGASFGYNRNESIDEYQSVDELIHLLADLVSKGGNLLLNIGPTADGRIPVIMQQRLLAMGQWLAVNGEAIYGTQPVGDSKQDHIRYTQTDDAVYVICFEWPGEKLVMSGLPRNLSAEAQLLGTDATFPIEQGAVAGIDEIQNALQIKIDPAKVSLSEIANSSAYVFKIPKK